MSAAAYDVTRQSPAECTEANVGAYIGPSNPHTDSCWEQIRAVSAVRRRSEAQVGGESCAPAHCRYGLLYLSPGIWIMGIESCGVFGAVRERVELPLWNLISRLAARANRSLTG